MRIERLALVGCGLMGGSFALALRRAGLVHHVVSCGPDTAALEEARRLGVIDEIAPCAAQAAQGADLVLVAVPVKAAEGVLAEVAPVLGPDALLMDVGSTKRDVAASARRVLGERLARFVPAHPIAGKETAGVAHADAALYAGRQAILTPLPENPPALVQRAAALWEAIGARVRCMRPEAHDAAFAAVSHLPHLLAYAFFDGVAQQPEGADFLALAGPGFRDFTRIAASDPAVWRDILLTNRDEVLRQARQFRQALDGFEQLLRSGDAVALEDHIRQVAHARARWHLGAPPSPSR
ncbi:prephenate dehydrogenase [Azohydromonas caseinilytica]|uniref:Prephenate dehydrogenase/arogenate dehydrogenase family protein n=1 Tax=Azohydromonas caseinilytica TaxID=2728836 RepID=A0A848F297_9BURK|nr:prephenate dehydrogenase/arogenate dehydrogenase family protein [Azohydromonas caseinilytica]NML14177.1 prephenate dehydrogenase/arogenate dehydrogenase family protein [Azohydromonas caseinilytica]